jgi:hypothetical protein
MSAQVQHPCCESRSGGQHITRGRQAGGDGWYCSLPPEHEGDHAAHDLNVIRPSNLIATWSRS